MMANFLQLPILTCKIHTIFVELVIKAYIIKSVKYVNDNIKGGERKIRPPDILKCSLFKTVKTRKM